MKIKVRSARVLRDNYRAMLFDATRKPPIKTPDKHDTNSMFYPRLLCDGFVRLCNHGTLHGLKYITDKKKMIGERVIWTMVCIVSIATCGMYIYSSWQKWVSVPFSLVIDKEYTPIYDIPFPTVVICPENTVKKSVIDLETSTDKVLLFAASLICENMPAENYSLREDFGPEVDEKILNFLKKSTPSCGEIIKRCRWKTSTDSVDDTYDCCEKYFTSQLINNGVCYAFNYAKWQHASKSDNFNVWDPEFGYDFDTDTNSSYPKRVLAVGEEFGLSVDLYFNSSDTQPFCDGPGIGFKILMNPPYESIVARKFASVPMERQTTFSITPKKVSTDVSMVDVKPDIRKCYFNNEKKLSYFEFYSRYNCILECEIRFSIRECACVPFYFHKAKKQRANLKICTSFDEYECLRRVQSELNAKAIGSYYATKPGSKMIDYGYKDNETDWCRCYPSCSELGYNMEVFYSDFVKMNNTENPPWANFTLKMNEVTRFDVTFKEGLILGFHREINYDTMDFIGSIGGMLSLFIGFSIMSIVEMIYYVVVEPIFILLKIRH